MTDLVKLGVHPAAPRPDGGGGKSDRVPPYVPRDIDGELRQAVAAGGLVVLVGESTAGKSRAAFEAVRATCPDHQLVVPARPDAVANLDSIVSSARRVVVWLDDLERFLGPDGLTLTVLTTWLAGREGGQMVVVATIRTPERQRFTPGEETVDGQARSVWRTAREVLEQAVEIDLARRWSPVELDRAGGYTDDPRIEQALTAADRFGVAETLAAGPQLARDWTAAWTRGMHPRAAALVAAAVDARRAGLDAPLSRDVLIGLHEHYLAERGGALLRPEPEAAALDWATRPVHATSSLLLPTGADGYIAFDYLVDLPHLPPVPEPTWALLAERTSPEQAYRIGQIALDQHHYTHAVTAFTRAAEADIPLGRYYLAVTLGEAGRPDHALSHLGQVLTHETATRGPDHPSTLTTRYQIARWTGEGGDATGALEAYRKLLADRTRVLGADHPDTLTTRSQIAYYTGEVGDATGALEAYQQLLADRTRVLGADHPDTLTTRHLIAYYTGDVGDATGALEAYRKLLADMVRVLGADHTDTLTTRHQIARWTGQLGDATGALEAYQQLLADMARVLGADHTDTLTTRHQIAYYTGEAGDAADALKRFEEVFDDELRIFGPNHPRTLTTRSQIARWTGGVGDTVGALEAYRQLLADRTRVLGPNHPDTLTTRHQIARWTGQLGDATGALEAYQQLLVDMVRVRGADHPNTLTTHYQIAYYTGEAGDAAGALRRFEEVFDEELRVYGPNHPRILTTRSQIARWTGEVGDAAGALNAYQQLLADRTRVLGPNHPDTLTTRSRIARWTKRLNPDQTRGSRL